jgi:hypothetical protein
MQSVIRKIKSLPILLRKEERPLSRQQVLEQINKVEDLVNTMIDDANDYTVIIFPCNKFPEDRHLYPRNSRYRILSEAFVQQPPRSFLSFLLSWLPTNSY